MAQIRLTPKEAILYVTLLNIGIGIILGAIPLILGFLRKKRKYAMFGFIGSIIGGAILGIFLSIPIATVFTWLITRNENEVGIKSSEKSLGHAVCVLLGAGLTVVTTNQLLGIGGLIVGFVSAIIGLIIGELVYLVISEIKAGLTNKTDFTDVEIIK